MNRENVKLFGLFLLVVFAFGAVSAEEFSASCDPTPDCPFTASSDGVVVDFSKRLFSTSGDTYEEEESVSLTTGLYDVSLASYDSYTERVNHSQPHEQFKIVFMHGNSVVNESGESDDLDDNVETASWDGQVSSNLLISQEVDSIVATHAYYADDSSPNSLGPICALIERVGGCSDDSDCDHLTNSCGVGVCEEGSCDYSLIADKTGPVTSDLDVTKYSEICQIKIEAVETDMCSMIEEAEYFLGGSNCGAEGSGIPLAAEDGNFNELIEDVIGSYIYVSDGSLNVHVRGKDVAGNWGNCQTVQINLDCLPPHYPACELEDVPSEVGFVLDEDCDAEELLVCDDDPTLSAFVCDDQSNIQAAEYFINEDSPINWQGIFMNASDGAFYDERCEEVEAVIDMDELAEGTHYVIMHAKDTQENWGKFYDGYNVSFIKDTMAPLVYKELLPMDDVSIDCINTWDSMNEHDLTHGCEFVKSGTEIVLSADDSTFVDDHEFAGDVVIHYNVWWSENGSSWEVVDSGESLPNENITITLTGDSFHLVEFWAVDACGYVSGPYWELDVIDEQAPVSVSEVFGPYYNDTAEGKFYVDGITEIGLTCVDPEPHPVGGEVLKYRYEYEDIEKGRVWTSWKTYQSPFGFPEESMHVLEYYCYDLLNNSEAVHSETYYVDHTKPVTDISYDVPFYQPDGYPKWINSSTEITLNATDDFGEEHDSGVNYTRYRVSLVDDDACWSAASGCNAFDGNESVDWISVFDDVTFTIPETSCHLIEYYSVDMVNKTEVLNKDCVFVDNEAPVSNYTITGPKFYNQTEDKTYIDNVSRVVLTCTDSEPHPSGDDKIFYKYTVDGNLTVDWTEYTQGTEGIHFPEESHHVISYYCVDFLGNVEEPENVLDVYVDHSKPTTNISFGTPYYTNGTSEWITSDTNITLTATDDYGEEHDSGVYETYYRWWRVDDSNCYDQCLPNVPNGDYAAQTSNRGVYNGPFNIPESSCHLIEYHSVDNVLKTEEVNRHCVFVDNEAPETVKTVGEPKVHLEEKLDIYYDKGWLVNGSTEITFVCEDVLPHPVNDVTMFWRWKYSEFGDVWTDWSENITYDGSPITFSESSYHMIEYWCVDALGNEEAHTFELDAVDLTAPESWKEISSPNLYWKEVIGAADRIVDLQDDDGSWDWVVTDKTGPTGITYTNIAGVTAEVLLDAYAMSNNPVYLEAAKAAGDYLIDEIGTPNSGDRYNAFSMIYLYRLAEVSGESEYSDLADALLAHTLYEENYWSFAHPSDGVENVNCGATGCSASELLEALKDFRSWSSDPTGIVAWDLHTFIEAANEGGEVAFANNMAAVIDAYISQTGYDDSVEYYALGLSGGIIAMDGAGMDYSAHLDALLADQNVDGSFTNLGAEPIQTTAYALMALEVAGEDDAAYRAGVYLIENLGYSGLNGWLESDGKEYSEVTSEAAQALYFTVLRRDIWITQGTEISLYCEDPAPHASGHEKIYWRYDVDELGFSKWMLYNGEPIVFGEDSNHTIEWYCVDYFGNEEEVNVEIDRVDTKGPNVTRKFAKIMRDGENEYGEVIEGGSVGNEAIVALRSEDSVKLCAELIDYKANGDLGVGVMEVGYRFEGMPDPELIWDNDENAYCVEIDAQDISDREYSDCGKWRFEVIGIDWLGNQGEWTNGIEIIIDNVAPVGQVLNPHAGNYYRNGVPFQVYAPAVDFGGEYCSICDYGMPGNDCPASGVDYCDLYAIDYNFEGMNQSEIKKCYRDLWTYFEQIGENPAVEYLGRVPYENGVCKGTASLPEDSNMTDTVFLGINYVDKAGNSGNKLFNYFHLQLALNPWFSPITMNIDNDGPMVYVESSNLPGPVTSEQNINVNVEVAEAASGFDGCWADIYMNDLGKLGSDTGLNIDGYAVDFDSCEISGELPNGLDSGDYFLEVNARDEKFNTGSVTVPMIVDNTRPTMSVIAPLEGEVYGEMFPISLNVTDSQSEIAEETVKFKISEIPALGNAYCLFGSCETTGWVGLDENGDLYSKTINLSEYEISGQGRYVFDAVACDDLYVEDLGTALGFSMNNDRTDMHCRMISEHGQVVEESRPACSDGIDNDLDGYIDYPSDYGCDSASDDDEVKVYGENIKINEFVANNDSEWVELYNPHDYSVDLNGWTLSDGGSWSEVLSGSIGAEGYLVVDANNLNNGGDEIKLSNSFDVLVDDVSYGNWNDGNLSDNAPVDSNGGSVGRLPNGIDSDADDADFDSFEYFSITAGFENAHLTV